MSSSRPDWGQEQVVLRPVTNTVCPKHLTGFNYKCTHQSATGQTRKIKPNDQTY